ncbi:hypothetical protein [Nonomuraea sp. NPDC023979]|uniref:hypothetical protein n=1 Tax=Nonomuraea sp. NPDC023979 TaxID=3154796 RepID=UPI003407E2C9
MGDISYLQAWQMWWDGQSTLGNDMLGLPMIWWGRIGKIAQFTGGCTVLLEILGPDRIRALGRKTRKASPRRTFYAYAILAALTSLALTLILTAVYGREAPEWLEIMIYIPLYAFFPLAVFALQWIPNKIADFLERTGRVLNWIRLLAFTLIAAGFHLDLLAS